MKKLENFIRCLGVLKKADTDMVKSDEIYRTGVIGQFDLPFELAWEALQAVLRIHGVEESRTGSPLEIVKLGYKTGFLDDGEIWLMMLEKRNKAIHSYDETEALETVSLIFERFIPTFEDLSLILSEKIKEAEE